MKKKDFKKENLSVFFEKQYKASWEYVRESKNFIYSIILLFFVFVVIGFFVPVPESIQVQILEYFESIVAQTQGLSWLELISFLLNNNAVSGFFVLFSGFALGIFPIFSTIINGFILGFASSFAVSHGGIFSLWKILPHGIFELPAIFISFGLGLKFSTFIFKKNKWEAFKLFLEKSILAYVFIILPLLVIAAIIEGTLIFFRF